MPLDLSPSIEAARRAGVRLLAVRRRLAGVPLPAPSQPRQDRPRAPQTPALRAFPHHERSGTP